MPRVAKLFGLFPYTATGVRLLAAGSLVLSAAVLAGIAVSDLPAGRVWFATALSIALGALALAAALPAIVSGRLRLIGTGIPTMALSLVASAAIGLGLVEWATACAGFLFLGSILTVVYHGMGWERRPARSSR
ncbi:hypothetical protein [Agrococcus sp. Marseille-P2731]|uniref:hypothetical protein n=1 Tax=Agrococcus sp. Marseille-P2731 TaxID=1841862 RepID=UPI000930503A|nr:hypothetical protein [Agrococcus sp. Marseille-P2731]